MIRFTEGSNNFGSQVSCSVAKPGILDSMLLKGLTLYSVIRPGTFVQIDVNQRRIHAGTYGVIEDRPVYFVELRRGFTCEV